ncbi:MAG: lysylphosphatidylglycerol synthase transmembrane domain-containing protein [Nitrolancea sp.]
MTVENTATGRGPFGARRLMPLIVWVSVALGVLVLVLTGEMGNMIDAFSDADWWLIAPLLAVGCALPIVHARRWQVMLRSLEHDLSLESAIDLTITSTMINYAAPGYLWSPAKGLLARQMYGIGLGRSVPTLAVEQVVDAFALVVGTILGLILAGPVISREILDRLSAPSAGILAVAVLALVAIVAIGLFVVWRFGRRFAVNLAEAARLLARDRSLRVPVVEFTAARWVLDTLAIWLAAKALGVSLGLSALILISNLPLLIGLISPMPGGIGFREGAMAGVAGVMALPVAAILAAAILHRAALLLALPIVLAAIRLRRWALA